MNDAGITSGVSELIKAIRFGSPSEQEMPNLTREQILSIMLDCLPGDDEEE